MLGLTKEENELLPEGTAVPSAVMASSARKRTSWTSGSIPAPAMLACCVREKT